LKQARLSEIARDRLAGGADEGAVGGGEHPAAGDAKLSVPRRKPLPLEAPGVNTRYFVNAAGDERAYALKRGESRRLTPDDCVRQFAESGYCRKGPPYSGPTSPTG